jgi:hypothetical protein
MRLNGNTYGTTARGCIISNETDEREKNAKIIGRHSRNQIGKQGLTTENAEFAEIFDFKVSFSPPYLRREFSISSPLANNFDDCSTEFSPVLRFYARFAVN